jgi:hypothetical protein
LVCHFFFYVEEKVTKVSSPQRKLLDEADKPKPPLVASIKNTTCVVVFLIEYLKLALTYSPPEGVPSVLAGLTSVFGMGTGVPPPLEHQL